MKRLVYTIILVLISFSCTKEIDMNFDSIKPKIFIEGTLTDSSSLVYLFLTNDVEDSVYQSVKNAEINIIGEDGMNVSLKENDSFYSNNESFVFKNQDYNIKIKVNGNEYSANTTMLDYVPIDTAYFRWFTVYSDLQILYCSFDFMDNPETTDYYYYTIYQNGKEYSWDITDDEIADKTGTPGKITANVSCMTSKTAEDDPDADYRLYDGDKLKIVLRHIDKKCYDYLKSIQVSSNNYSNPKSYFSNGALGFFVAFRPSYYELTY